MPKLRSITAIPVICNGCPWTGVTGECEPDEDGTLLCPDCNDVVEIQYNDHERSPEQQKPDSP